MRIDIPIPQAALVDASGNVTREWRVFFMLLAQALGNDTSGVFDQVLEAVSPADFGAVFLELTNALIDAGSQISSANAALDELRGRVEALETLMPAIAA